MGNRYFIIVAIVSIMLSLFGCRNSKMTPEEKVKRYLEKKYKSNFTVQDMTRKPNGAVSTTYYSGYAYEGDNSLFRGEKGN